MKRVLLAVILSAFVLFPAVTTAQAPGALLFEQGCDVFDLVEDLGSNLTLTGQMGRWLVRNLETGHEFVYAFEAIDLLPPPPTDPNIFEGTTYVAWEFEGTRIRGTNKTDFTVTTSDLNVGSSSVFFQGETIRGNRYKSGGISGTSTILVTFPPVLVYENARIILCKKAIGGRGHY